MLDKEMQEKIDMVKKGLGMDTMIESKADEANHTTNVGEGAEFVDTQLSTNILTKLRERENFSSKFPSAIDMPTSTYELPIEGADPVFNYTGENTDVPGTEYGNSKAGTGKITLVAKKFTAITYLSGELDEDGIVNMRGYVENKMSLAYGETLDKVLINGDTETGATGNVNSDDAAPAAGSYYLAADGLRKTAIANGNVVDAGALDLADIRESRSQLGENGNKGLNPNELVLGVGTDVYYKLLALTQAETVEKFGGAATVVNGTLAAIDGIEVVPSGFIPKTEADGKVSSVTPANNTLGTAILTYKEDVIRGFKRNIKTFVEYLPATDQFRITAHFRYAQLIKTTKSVSAIINITL